MCYFMNSLRIKFYNQGNWGQYRNTFVMQSQNLHRRGDEEQAFQSHLYLAYLDRERTC